MSFVINNLSTNESIIYKAQLHWWVFVKGILLLLLGFFFFDYSNALGGVLLTIGIIDMGIQYLNKSNSEFVITNKRVILKTGVITRRLVELQLNKAEGLAIEQGLIGRIFDFGSVIVASGGVKTPFAPIAMPFVFKRQINEAIDGKRFIAHSPLPDFFANEGNSPK